MTIAEHEIVPYSAQRQLASGPVVVFAPHPDDEVFGCGGAIMRHLQAGDAVRVVILTDGAFNAGPDLAATRCTESRQAGAILGYGDPEFWSLPDRGLEYGETLIARLTATLAEQRARVVYAPSWWEVHPDHLTLALSCAEAVRRHGGALRLAMYEIGVPLHPSHLIDITDLRARKRQAMDCFASQQAHQDYSRHIAALNSYRTYTLGPQVEAAEAFRVLDAEQLRADPLQAIRPGHFHAQPRAANAARAPLVSIVLAPWTDPDQQQAEAAQRAALEALLLQTHANVELIVPIGPELPVAPTETVQERFAVRTVACHRKTPAAILNHCMEQTRGDYLTVIDAETRLDPDHLTALLVRLATAAPARAALAGVRRPENCGRPDNQTMPFDLLTHWLDGTHSPHALLFSRTLLADGCRFDERLRDERLEGDADWDFLMQIARRTPIAHLGRATGSWQPCRHARAVEHRQTPRGDAPARVKWASLWASETQMAQLRALRQQAASATVEPPASDSEEIARLTRELNACQRDLAAMRSSTIWRLSAPLRRLTMALRARRRG